jgi:hypothetical protein
MKFALSLLGALLVAAAIGRRLTPMVLGALITMVGSAARPIAGFTPTSNAWRRSAASADGASRIRCMRRPRGIGVTAPIRTEATRR